MANQKPKIWVIEDDPECQFVLEQILAETCELKMFGTLESFKRSFNGTEPHEIDLILADLWLPDGSFLSFLNEVPLTIAVELPILILSVCDEVDMLNNCLNEGAFDYLTKPFNRNELQVKVRKAIHHFRNATEYKVDKIQKKISTSAELEASLTPTELSIIDFLSKCPQKSAKRSEIISAVWSNTRVGSKTFDVHIFNLRRKFSEINLKIRFDPPNSYTIIKQSDESNEKMLDF